jgi:hypothetical protein
MNRSISTMNLASRVGSSMCWSRFFLNFLNRRSRVRLTPGPSSLIKASRLTNQPGDSPIQRLSKARAVSHLLRNAFQIVV